MSCATIPTIPYFVVAADKGTATFLRHRELDLAEYGFWLDDAFASGGSVGYDHKKMGITAKGAWESVKRHFREMSVDTQSQDFTSSASATCRGDVFGNGMLLSKHISSSPRSTIATFFLDPTPGRRGELQGARAACSTCRARRGRTTTRS
jgi:glutamate dehydrogenase